MKTVLSLAAAAIGICAVGAVALYWRRRRSAEPEIKQEDPVHARFREDWTIRLTEHAHVFNGLFSGLYRIQAGRAKKPEKILTEWCRRNDNKWGHEPVNYRFQELLTPLLESKDPQGFRLIADLLLEAAAAAGITKDETVSLLLTENNVGAYIEWDDEDLYPGDEVEIVSPAWYQNGKILEQGQCRKIITSE